MMDPDQVQNKKNFLYLRMELTKRKMKDFLYSLYSGIDADLVYLVKFFNPSVVLKSYPDFMKNNFLMKEKLFYICLLRKKIQIFQMKIISCNYSKAFFLIL